MFLFYNGIFNIISSFIYILLEYVVVVNLPYDPKKEIDYKGNYFVDNYKGIFTLLKGQKSEFYLYFFIIFILLFAYYIISALTIYNFNLYLIIIVETCLPIDNDMIEIFYKDNVFNKGKILTRALFQCIGYIIIIISALILNEIIILKFLGFNKNIRDSITFRGKLEVEGSIDLERNSNERELGDCNLKDTDSEK